MTVPSLVKKGKQIVLDKDGGSSHEKQTEEFIAERKFENSAFLSKMKVVKNDEKCKKG